MTVTLPQKAVERMVMTLGYRGDGMVVIFGTQKLASGKRLHSYGKIHHFQWENPLFLWSCSIAMLNYQRVWILMNMMVILGNPNWLVVDLPL